MSGSGRRGIRTRAMLEIARERIDSLFTTAKLETAAGRPARADRCATLARKIGMRYNIRLSREQRALLCKTCGSYLGSAGKARVRLGGKRRTITCLKCGTVKRTGLSPK